MDNVKLGKGKDPEDKELHEATDKLHDLVGRARCRNHSRCRTRSVHVLPKPSKLPTFLHMGDVDSHESPSIIKVATNYRVLGQKVCEWPKDNAEEKADN